MIIFLLQDFFSFGFERLWWWRWSWYSHPLHQQSSEVFTEAHAHPRRHTHKHTEASGSCLCGGQIKYLFSLSGERLDRAPLILSLWEPLVPWITLSLGAPRQTSSHAPLCSKPRQRPYQPRAPTLSDPPLRHRGGGRWWRRNPRQIVDVRDGAWREGGDGGRWRE